MLEVAFTDFFVDFVIAIGLGALIGLEREHRRDQTQVIAGVRTFPLFSASGYLLAYLAAKLDEPLLVVAGVLVTGAVALAFLVVRHLLGTTGLTTPMAIVVTFTLGVLVGYGLEREAVVVAVATTFLLLTKDRLHRFASLLDDDEIMGALQFITVLFIAFPFTVGLSPPVLGQAWLGRGALVDPYFILLVVIFVSSISFVSFLAMRRAGPRRGVVFSGLLGGLVSSEATAVSLAEHAARNPPLVRAAVLGAVLATTTMFVRNVAIAAFADPSLSMVRAMLPVIVPMAAAGLVLAYFQYTLARKKLDGVDGAAIRVRNPFAIGPAVKFALLFAGLSAASVLARTWFGTAGVYAAALGGLVSAGAVTASMAAVFLTGNVPLEVAARTAVLATLVGAGNKLLLLRTTNVDVFQRARTPFLTLTIVGAVAILAAALLL